MSQKSKSTHANKQQKSTVRTAKKRKLRLGRLFLLLFAVCLVIGAAGGLGWIVYAKYMESQDDSGRSDSASSLLLNTHAREVKEIQQANAGTQVVTDGFTDAEVRSCFYSSEIDDKLAQRLEAMKYAGHEAELPIENIRYIKVLYRNFQNESRVGEIMVNADIAMETEEVFYNLYTHRYQIQKMLLPDAYGGDADASSADNNTVGLVFGMNDENGGPMHAAGLAIDLNPVYNPLIVDEGSAVRVYPLEGQLYVDRTVHAPHYIYEQDYACTAFLEQGFVWKGDVQGKNDYKHFEKGTLPASMKTTDTTSTDAGNAADAAQTQSQSETQTEQPVQQTEVPQTAEPEVPAAVQEPVQTEPVYEEPVYWAEGEDYVEEGLPQWE